MDKIYCYKFQLVKDNKLVEEDSKVLFRKPEDEKEFISLVLANLQARIHSFEVSNEMLDNANSLLCRIYVSDPKTNHRVMSFALNLGSYVAVNLQK